MKYLYIGVGLMVATLAASILSLVLLNRYVNEAAGQLDKALQALDRGDDAAAFEAAQKAEAAWERHSGFLNAIMDHSETDNIQWELADIRSFAQSGDRNEFRASCEKTAEMMRHVAHTEKPYYYNVL